MGGVAAGLLAGPLYGTGATWLKKMLPWIKPTEDGSEDGERKDNQKRTVTKADVEAPLYAAKQKEPAQLGAAPGESAADGATGTTIV